MLKIIRIRRNANSGNFSTRTSLILWVDTPGGNDGNPTSENQPGKRCHRCTRRDRAQEWRRRMSPTRTLRKGASGGDVLAVKQRLLELGCYTPEITSLKTDVFGTDTRRAVLAFQAAQGLESDGIVGPNTYAALFPENTPASFMSNTPASFMSNAPELPAHLPESARTRIAQSLAGESVRRREIVLDALSFAVSPDAPGEYPLSLYIRGGNLYNKDLTPNVITLDRIARGAARQQEFYDGGRREMMERAVRVNSSITGADCSGGVVGLLRHAGLVRPTFDCSADGFASGASAALIDCAALRPGDFLHKSGHVGLYAGGGYAVEWMGGAYGCQLTSLGKRRGWNYVKRKLDNCGAWTGFLRPKYYKEQEENTCRNGTSLA